MYIYIYYLNYFLGYGNRYSLSILYMLLCYLLPFEI